MKRIHGIILLATVLFLSQLACSSGNQANAPASTNTQNAVAETKTPGAANVAASPATSNAPANANTGAKGKEDPFSELVLLSSQLFTARMKGDKAKAEGLLADDYKETTGDGKTLNKSQVLASISPDKKFDSYTLDNLKSTETGDTGTVTGNASVLAGGKTESWKFTETFRKQQGRWQAASSKITEYKKS